MEVSFKDVPYKKLTTDEDHQDNKKLHEKYFDKGHKPKDLHKLTDLKSDDKT